MAVEVRSLRMGELDECIRLWQTVWSGNPPGYFERYFQGDDAFDPEYACCCFVDGQLVSAVQIVRRELRCGDARVVLGGIANVATLPEHRGGGYSTLCMRRSVEVMELREMDLSVLFTGIDGFYARLGWEGYRITQLAGAIPENARVGAGAIEVRPYRAGDDPGIRAAHTEYNANRLMTVVRPGSYWAGWLRWENGRHYADVAVADVGGSVVGYTVSRTADDGWRHVFEIGVRDAAPEGTVAALLSATAAAGRAGGAERLGLFIPSTAEVRAWAEGALDGCESTVRRGGMVRLTHPTGLLERAMPELDRRWRAAGSPAGMLGFATPYGALAVRSGSSGLVLQRDPGEARLLPQAELVALVFGRGVDSSEMAPEDAAFALALAPGEPGWYWGQDGF